MCFKVRKWTKRHQGTKKEQNQAKNQSHKNRTIRFVKPNYPIFPEQIESDYDLGFSLFRKDLRVYELKSYVILSI
jgi:hypothetical protein